MVENMDIVKFYEYQIETMRRLGRLEPDVAMEYLKIRRLELSLSVKDTESVKDTNVDKILVLTEKLEVCTGCDYHNNFRKDPDEIRNEQFTNEFYSNDGLRNDDDVINSLEEANGISYPPYYRIFLKKILKEKPDMIDHYSESIYDETWINLDDKYKRMILDGNMNDSKVKVSYDK